MLEFRLGGIAQRQPTNCSFGWIAAFLLHGENPIGDSAGIGPDFPGKNRLTCNTGEKRHHKFGIGVSRRAPRGRFAKHFIFRDGPL
jgi:hypothetical protein